MGDLRFDDEKGVWKNRRIRRQHTDYKFWSGQHTLYYHWSIVIEDACSRNSEQDKRSWENPCIWSSITGTVILCGFPPSWSLSGKFRGKVWRSLQFSNIKRIFRMSCFHGPPYLAPVAWVAAAMISCMPKPSGSTLKLETGIGASMWCKCNVWDLQTASSRSISSV